jgi:MYXO-CTERM domain-containing protein
MGEKGTAVTCERSLRRSSEVLGALVVLAGVAYAAPARALGPMRTTTEGTHYRDLCDSSASSTRHCDVKIVTDAAGKPLVGTAGPVGGYGPADIQSAYGLSPTGGNGRLVAIFGGGSDYPQAESDLATYRAQFGLPECSTANGCFQKVDQNGGTNYPAAGDNEVEQALDMAMASAACPGCRIMLIEGGDMGVALQTVIKAGASAFSFSILYGYGNATASECTNLGFDANTGLVMTGALGDTAYPGARDFIPAACQGVLAVGGTTLNKVNGGRGWTETTWGGTGGGCSPFVAKPSWQTDTGCSMRMEADIAAVADPNTGVAFYCTQGSGGWGVVGGTSAASPLVSGALTNLGVANGHFTPAWIWQNAADLYDVDTGNNGTCAGSPDYFCNAKVGYDGPTGWGTPNGQLLSKAPPPGTTQSDGGVCTTPPGSYLQSCVGCSAQAQGAGCVLICQSCTRIDGTQSPDPTLDLPCNGSISNQNGALVCDVVDAGPTPDDAGAQVDDASVPRDGGVKPPPIDGGGPTAGGGPDAAPGLVVNAATGLDTSSGCACSAGDASPATGPLAAGAGVALVLGLRRRSTRRKSKR